MSKVSPFLWFEDKAQEAVEFYKATFRNVKIDSESYLPGPAGKLYTASITIEDQPLQILEGGSMEGFRFNPSISFMVRCDDQAEIDELWQKLTADGGKAIQCGWLDDKFGLTWQIVPRALLKLMNSPDKAANARVAEAMMKMVKFDIAKLEQAAKGK